MYIPNKDIWKKVNELYKLKFNQLVENSETKLVVSFENLGNEISYKAYEKPQEHCGLTVQSQEFFDSHIIWYMVFGKLGEHTVELNTNPSKWVVLLNYTHFMIPRGAKSHMLLHQLKEEHDRTDAKIRAVEESEKHIKDLIGKSKLESEILQSLLGSDTKLHLDTNYGYVERTYKQQINSIEELEYFFNQVSPQFLWCLIPK